MRRGEIYLAPTQSCVVPPRSREPPRPEGDSFSREADLRSRYQQPKEGARGGTMGFPHDQVPSSHDARYVACSSVSSSIETPIVASLSRAISSSISFGTS